MILARGDRRGFVAVDRHGEVYAIARWVGIKTKDVRARLGDARTLPGIDEALERHRERDREPQRATPRADPCQPLWLPREDAEFTAKALRRNPALILDHVSKTKARFGREDVRRALADHLKDGPDLGGATDTALASKELVRLDEKHFTTRHFQRAEEDLRRSAAVMAKAKGFGVERRHVRAAIAKRDAGLRKEVGAGLSAQQSAAIEHVLGPQQLSCVVGLAGAGKSTLLDAAREGWEAQGLRVHGAALSGKAADGLQSASGISSRTLASLELSWKNGYEPIGKGDVLVVDEAGMVGTRQMARIAESCRSRGCKLVMVGDPDQLQPIEAGTPFREVVVTHGAARLTEIRRQRADWQVRASADLAAGKTQAALERYARQGCVREGQSADAAIAALVEDYANDLAQDRSTSRLALAHRRKDVHALNQEIRAAWKAKGDLEDETFVETEHGPRAFASRDRLIFTRNDAKLGVRNGMLGTVGKVADGVITVRLDGEKPGDGRTVTVRTDTFNSFDHGYAVSIHRAQGATVEQSYVLSSRRLDRHLAYVAMTRHRGTMRFYAAPDTLPRGVDSPQKAPQASARPQAERTALPTSHDGPDQKPSAMRLAYIEAQEGAQRGADRAMSTDRPRRRGGPSLDR